MRSWLELMQKAARILRIHEPLILNWFRAKRENLPGAVEGLNQNSSDYQTILWLFESLRPWMTAVRLRFEGQLRSPSLAGTWVPRFER
jgi:hypothetical protein